MAKFDAILFDVDGTIVDNMDAHLQAWVEYLGTLGINDRNDVIYKIVSGKTTREVIEYYFGKNLTEVQMRDHYRQKEALYKALYFPEMSGIAGVVDLFKQANELNVPMAVASAGGIDNVEFILNNLNLRQYFQEVVSARDVKRGKPDPEIFLLAAKRLGVDPSACLVFEDSKAGLEAATNAGMKAVAITTAMPASELEQYPAVIKIVDNYVGLDLEPLLEQAVA